MLVKLAREGNRADNVFQKEAWLVAEKELNSIYGCFLDIMQVKNKVGIGTASN